MNSIHLGLIISLMCGIMIQHCHADLASSAETNNAAIKEKLKAFDEAFDDGSADWEDVLSDASPMWLKAVTDYYLQHSNSITLKMKLPISRCFALSADFPKALELATEYADVYSNDWRAWRIITGSRLAMNSYEEALTAAEREVELGDDHNYAGFGVAALALNRFDILQTNVIPHILAIKDMERFDREERLSMRIILVSYAIEADKREIFEKALEGITVEDILSKRGFSNLVVHACDTFEADRTNAICLELSGATPSHPKQAATGKE
jgi:tetratricopeptide (TPR) repeat protein